ncbi:hypothetical protein KYB31_12050 [Clostridium felsineum]|uniref:hypothetical protein n=1 Tax=Clostridium felsineum TaxID=36839 RepID=UPI00214DBFDC|nr:hypothetical protein [Clostridium felsineum]MCR3759711.1 hypothetical protein [Clostridium felsineum]
MKEFQIAAFIGNIFIFIFLMMIGIVGFYRIVIKNYRIKTRSRKKRYAIKISVTTLMLILIISSSIILIPMTKDIPVLISGNFAVEKGYIDEIKKDSKGYFETVYINGVGVTFSLESNMNTYTEYSIEYLPNSQEGITAKEVNSKNKEVKSPIMDFLIGIMEFILCMAVMFLIFFKYNEIFKILGVIGAVFYALNIYSYIKIGKSTGAWLNINDNYGLEKLILETVILFALIMFYFIEKIMFKRKCKRRYVRKEEKSDAITKVFAVIVIIVFIVLIYINPI